MSNEWTSTVRTLRGLPSSEQICLEHTPATPRLAGKDRPDTLGNLRYTHAMFRLPPNLLLPAALALLTVCQAFGMVVRPYGNGAIPTVSDSAYSLQSTAFLSRSDDSDSWPTLNTSYLAETCANDPVNGIDPLGLATVAGTLSTYLNNYKDDGALLLLQYFIADDNPGIDLGFMSDAKVTDAAAAKKLFKSLNGKYNSFLAQVAKLGSPSLLGVQTYFGGSFDDAYDREVNGLSIPVDPKNSMANTLAKMTTRATKFQNDVQNEALWTIGSIVGAKTIEGAVGLLRGLGVVSKYLTIDGAGGKMALFCHGKASSGSCGGRMVSCHSAWFRTPQRLCGRARPRTFSGIAAGTGVALWREDSRLRAAVEPLPPAGADAAREPESRHAMVERELWRLVQPAAQPRGTGVSGELEGGQVWAIRARRQVVCVACNAEFDCFITVFNDLPFLRAYLVYLYRGCIVFAETFRGCL